MLHQSQLPYSYYDTALGKIILTLITPGNITAARVVYGDPFYWEKTGRKDERGNAIWEWFTEEAPMHPQYTAKAVIHWRAALTPTKAKRMKYSFLLTTHKGEEITFDENGEGRGDALGHFFFPFVHEIDAPRAPAWAAQTCWYQIFPERFCNGEPALSPPEIGDWLKGTPKGKNFFGGDLRGIIKQLPYLHALGVTGIYLTPIFHSPSNHKYDVQDYFAIDPHFGSTADLKELVKKAHAKGMKIMLDAVFNHIGGAHPFWQDVLKKQEKSKYRDYFHIHSFPVRKDYPTREALNYDTFAHVANMPKWNTEHPGARKHLIDSAVYWIKECDIDGWRLDVSDEVSFDFWRELRAAVDAAKPDFYLVGEVWHDPSKWLNNGYFDAVMNYPLAHILRDLFFTQSISPDVFTQKLFAKLGQLSDLHNTIRFNLMDSHDTVRALTQADGDKTAMKNAFLFMYLMKGAPSLYYGTEVGMAGDGDPGSRAPMVWDAARQDKSLMHFFTRLIALRKTHNALIQGADIAYTRKKGLCRWKLGKGPEALGILYNAGEEPIRLKHKPLLATQEDGTNRLPPKTCAVV
ncbi:MAG: alpha amylase N-terminal ig-like domain-containing protein [Defluviitaleaceae bacterium]|nr:alpha amylase N-terminal ig-like domain-containing protein [Defluviitaleaceae bacterium]MCL2238459.1 alpha amylase N-terminal ig-like domain-containing protein [Defluviitaleaceae bacterium]